MGAKPGSRSVARTPALGFEHTPVWAKDGRRLPKRNARSSRRITRGPINPTRSRRNRWRVRTIERTIGGE